MRQIQLDPDRERVSWFKVHLKTKEALSILADRNGQKTDHDTSQEEERILSGSGRRIPVQKEFWTEPSNPGEQPKLLGHECRDCGEIFFPKRDNGICTHCQSRNLVETKLSSKGKIYNYTIVEQKPPAYYRGEVPYALGFVELPEGIRLRSLFTGCDLNDLKVGMEVEMVIERLFENDEGEEIITYKFRPVGAS